MLPRAPPLLPRSSSYRAMNSNHSIQTSQLKPINQTTQLKPINSIRTIQNQPLNSTFNSTPMILSNPIALWLLSASLLQLPRAFLSTPIALWLLSASLVHLPRAFSEHPFAKIPVHDLFPQQNPCI